MITYNTTILGDSQELKKLLEYHRFVVNYASKQQFPEQKNSLVILHSKVYHNVRKSNPEIPSQVVIKAEQEVLASYRSAKSNKHKKKLIEKKNLSMRLDKRLYSIPDKFSIRITTTGKRQTFKFVVYPRLKELMEKYQYKDPLIYEDNGKICIAFSFENKVEKVKQRLALGVDLGIRRSAAMSDGRVIIDRKFNGDKRRLRHIKDELKSKGTKSSRRKLRYSLRRKERNKNKNQTHLISNIVLNTNADTICLENLKSIKRKKNKYQNKHSIGQVPLYELRRVITYKAENAGKSVVLVSPQYTSQIDSMTGLLEGDRRGCRFFAKSGLVYDADLNAAMNIAKRSKLPVSYGNILDGQASVNTPNKYKSPLLGAVQAPIPLG
jgi:IS605 OrfB family transposase